MFTQKRTFTQIYSALAQTASTQGISSDRHRDPDRQKYSKLPFVARQNELDLAQTHAIRYYKEWLRFGSSKTGVTFVTGAHGTGKSRFGKELLASLAVSPLASHASGLEFVTSTPQQWLLADPKPIQNSVVFIDEATQDELPRLLAKLSTIQEATKKFIHFIVACEDPPSDLQIDNFIVKCGNFKDSDITLALDRLCTSTEGVWLESLRGTKYFHSTLDKIGTAPASVALLLYGLYKRAKKVHFDCTQLRALNFCLAADNVTTLYQLPCDGGEQYHRDLFANLILGKTRKIWPLQFLQSLVQRANLSRSIQAHQIDEMLMSGTSLKWLKWERDTGMMLLLRLNALHARKDSFVLKELFVHHLGPDLISGLYATRTYVLKQHSTQFLKVRFHSAESLAPGIVWENQTNGPAFDYWFVLDQKHPNAKRTAVFVQCKHTDKITKMTSTSLIKAYLTTERMWKKREAEALQLGVDLRQFDIKFVAISNRELALDHTTKTIRIGDDKLKSCEKDAIFRNIVYFHRDNVSKLFGELWKISNS